MWCFWTVVLETTLESSLDCKEMQPVHAKGDQSWIFVAKNDAEAVILWPPDAKNWLRKNPDAAKDWRREEKGTTEDEMVEWHHWLDGHELSKLRELVMDREAWHAAVHGVTKSWTRLRDWTELNPSVEKKKGEILKYHCLSWLLVFFKVVFKILCILKRFYSAILRKNFHKWF